MGVLIDPSVLLEHQRGRVDLARQVAAHVGESIYVSVISAGELLRCAQHGSTPDARAMRSSFVEALLEGLPLLPLEAGAARMYARLRGEMGEAGRTMAQSDLWLASQALARGLVLAVGEPRDLGRVPGLELESWLTGR